MRKHLIIVGLISTVGRLFSSEIGLLPQEKAPVVLEESERNPFGTRQAKVKEVAEEKGVEEAQIRELLAQLPVKGVMAGRDRMKVLLGSLVVEEGHTLPPIIPNQTERIMVKAITEKQINLVFLEKNNEEGERKISLPLDVKPTVRYELGSQSGPVDKTPEKSTFGGVIKGDGTPATSR